MIEAGQVVAVIPLVAVQISIGLLNAAVSDAREKAPSPVESWRSLSVAHTGRRFA